MQVTLQKKFVPDSNVYSRSDIDNINHGFTEGIESIRRAVASSEGTYTLTETQNTLTVSIDPDEFAMCFESWQDGVSEYKSLVSGILATIDNYAMLGKVIR